MISIVNVRYVFALLVVASIGAFAGYKAADIVYAQQANSNDLIIESGTILATIGSDQEFRLNQGYSQQFKSTKSG